MVVVIAVAIVWPLDFFSLLFLLPFFFSGILGCQRRAWRGRGQGFADGGRRLFLAGPID